MASGSAAMGVRLHGHALFDFRCSYQTSTKHFEQCTEFLLLRNRDLRPLAMTVLPIAPPRGPPLPLAPPCNRQRPFFVAGDRQDFRLLRQRTIHPQVDCQSVIMLLSLHAIRNQNREVVMATTGIDICSPYGMTCTECNDL